MKLYHILLYIHVNSVFVRPCKDEVILTGAQLLSTGYGICIENDGKY